jgi:YgiT-type zinc finger domain-containing protein
MLCEFCGGNTKNKSVTRQHWFNKQLYIIENINTEVCAECGERYFHAKTLDDIDSFLFLSAEHSVKARLDIEIVRWSKAI